MKKIFKSKQLFNIAIARYRKDALEAKTQGNKEALKEAKWKVKYFKDKIRKRMVKNG